MTLSPGKTVLYDRSLKVKVVREIDNGQVIVQVGADTRIVAAVTLSEEEA